jgi:hypothetical protein
MQMCCRTFFDLKAGIHAQYVTPLELTALSDIISIETYPPLRLPQALVTQ